MTIKSNIARFGGALTVAFGVAAAHAAEKGRPIQVGMASWYGEEMAKGKKNGRYVFNKTASGDTFQPGGVSAAHKTLPLGSCVLAVIPKTGRHLIVEINDRGPYAKGRIIDFSRGAAERLGFKNRGEARVELYSVSCPS